MKIVIKLYYEEAWVAKGEGLYLTASSLLELKERLENCLAEKDLPKGSEIALVFDTASLPSWLRGEISVQELLIRS